MKKIVSQSVKLKDKLIKQFDLVSKKFKPKKNREESNRELTDFEVQVALYHYSTAKDSFNEYGEKNLEWLHDRLATLTERQMDIIRLKFWEGRSLYQIAEIMMMKHHEAVSRELHKIYEVLKK